MKESEYSLSKLMAGFFLCKKTEKGMMNYDYERKT